ncbi:MAG: hypothetical protein RSC38_06855, partial [Oscillospiraceae bacterium]
MAIGFLTDDFVASKIHFTEGDFAEIMIEKLRNTVDEKLFAFTLGKSSINNLYSVAAQYTQCCIDKPMRSLDFLNTVLT